MISAQSGAMDVSEEMRHIVTREHGSLSGVSSSRIIVLHISNPDVPFLDLVDLPGIVTAPSGNEVSHLILQCFVQMCRVLRTFKHFLTSHLSFKLTARRHGKPDNGTRQ